MEATIANRIERQATTDFGLFRDNLKPTTVKRIRTWIEALRSGKYSQGRGRLYQWDENCGIPLYCCLGVANEVCKLKETHDLFLATSWRKLGLKSSTGQFKGARWEDRTGLSLTFFNDKKGDNWTFEDIAQLLEDQLTVKGL